MPCSKWYASLAITNSHISPGIVNPSNTEYVLGNINTHVGNLYLFIWIEMVQVIEILPMEDKDSFILHSQHHVCWCPGYARSQGISSHGIDLVLPGYSGFSTIGVNALTTGDTASEYSGQIGSGRLMRCSIHLMVHFSSYKMLKVYLPNMLDYHAFKITISLPISKFHKCGIS